MRRHVHASVVRAAVGVLLGLVFACGEHMEADADMNRDLDRVFERADLMDRELDTHASAVASATDLMAVETAEAAHGDAIGPHMDDLVHLLGDMTTYCRHRSTQELGRTHEMQAAMTSMRDETERHRRAPRPDLEAARSEEEKHVRESRAIWTRVRNAGGRMRHEAGFYRCQHGNH